MLEFREAVENRDIERMEAALAPDVTFRSPAVFKPYEGREAVMRLLRTVLEVFEDFEYTDELAGESTHALIFRARAGGKVVEGLDHLTLDSDGRITELVVMVRPLSGLMAVLQLRGRLPLPNAINTYLLGDVLVDAGARFDGKTILSELYGRSLAAHALTHAHPDHQGSSKLVCETFSVPFWVPEGDAEKAERPEAIREEQPSNPINTIFFKAMAGPGRAPDRLLREGDEVAGFQVLDTPGHSRGHISFWRESDRVLVLGDVLNSMDVITAIPGLTEPKPYLTPDPAVNRASARRLGELEPSLVLFGHGPPERDTAKFVKFCASLPA